MSGHAGCIMPETPLDGSDQLTDPGGDSGPLARAAVVSDTTKNIVSCPSVLSNIRNNLGG